ncbi:hypothetical protein SAMN04487948_13028 [Halogranum amylolyticum]|uniref:Lipoprotein n=1 Tax=Halogranum amylolyticum TaxID=660520 RepID=A0A1H8WI16_9EURY|nr:hypothetical protein [Halogranum amylolyticum]SEP27286.1 hypothetical protein SAMN04487948_13028 [Halogranum amylolyticum]
MQRRTFLTGLTGVVATTAGCAGLDALGRRTDPIAEVRFEEITPRKDRPVGTDDEERDRYPPIVAWDDAASTIRITGFVFYGGGCDAPVLRTVELQADNRLFVSVGHREKWYLRLPIPLPIACTASLGGIHYRVTVRFADSAALPETVEVDEDNEAAPDAHRVVTRAEQDALCSRESFESEEQRATAHWTCPTE